MDFEFAQVREPAAVDSMEVEAALVRLLEGIVYIAVEQVGGWPQGLAVADSKGVGVAVAQELGQPAGGSMAEVRPGGVSGRHIAEALRWTGGSMVMELGGHESIRGGCS